METITLLLAGDVMLGRGIDQVMPEPLPPVLYEPWMHDAREYMRLAEKANGTMPAPVVPAEFALPGAQPAWCLPMLTRLACRPCAATSGMNWTSVPSCRCSNGTPATLSASK